MATTATCLYTLRGATELVKWACGNRLPPTIRFLGVLTTFNFDLFIYYYRPKLFL